MVETITLRISESQTFWLRPEFALLITGVGSLVVDRTDNISNYRLSADIQSIGPYLDSVKVSIDAQGDTEYQLYDLGNLMAEDLAELTTLAVGTRAWVIEETGRNEYYWDGVVWRPKSWTVVGVDAPDDGDGRPDNTIYFQI